MFRRTRKLWSSMIGRFNRSVLWVVVIASTAAAGAPDTLWTQAYGGSRWDDGNDVKEVSSGGFVVAGITQSFGAGSYDMYLLRTDDQGDTLWTRTFGGPELEDARSVIETSDGGFAMVGQTASSGAGGSDLYVVKTDADGNELWSESYGGTENEDGQAIVELPTGGFILLGQTASEGNGGDDIYLVRTNSVGVPLATRTYGGPENEDVQDARLLADGGLILAGSTYSFGMGSGDFYLVRTDAAGDTLWTRTYGGAKRELCIAVDVTADGGYLLAGQQTQPDDRDDAWIVRTDGEGNLLWSRTYGLDQSDAFAAIRATADGGAVSTGVFSDPDHGLETWLLKTDAVGDTVWTTSVHSAPGWDVWDIGHGLVITEDGDYVVTGQTGLFPGFHLSLIRFGAPTGILVPDPVSWPAPGQLSGSPNPFNPETALRFLLDRAGEISLAIHGSDGRCIRTLFEGHRAAGMHTFRWNGTDDRGRSVPSGVYVVRLVSNGRVETGRLVLLK